MRKRRTLTHNPKVSVLLAAYNRPQFIGTSIRSALDQTFRDFEVLVICDSNSDGTRLAVESFVKLDARLKYFEIPRIGRIAPVSNYGLAQASGEYVAILDDDDWWSDTEKLAKQVRFLDDHPNHVGCGGGYITVDVDGKETGRFLKPEQDEDIRRNALVANPMANAATMFRRAAAMAIGSYDETMKEFADWDFWLKMGIQGKLYNFPEYFLYYRMWPQGSSFTKQRGAAASALRIVRRHRNDYPQFVQAYGAALAYSAYAHLPEPLKCFLNGPFSRLKKSIFVR
jgi:glycosyltransferase involved in cell wall biosynthesis